MQYDFDREINRKNTQSAKWGIIQDPDNPSRWHPTDDYYGDNRILPMWVADMDFTAPQPVVDALVRRAQHGIYGYSFRTDDYDQAGPLKRAGSSPHRGWCRRSICSCAPSPGQANRY